MNYLFDYGEPLICFAPAFLIIAAAGSMLLANSWPSKGLKGGNENAREIDKDDILPD